MMGKYQQIENCIIGKGTKIWHFVNLYECTIGDECIIGSFVEMQRGVVLGRRVKIGSHSFLCSGVTIEDEVFVGHHVVFTNDKYPRATNKKGRVQRERDWKLLPTRVKTGASIGSHVTILPGITIAEYALIGAGSVVTKDVPPHTVAFGNPAQVVRQLGFSVQTKKPQ